MKGKLKVVLAEILFRLRRWLAINQPTILADRNHDSSGVSRACGWATVAVAEGNIEFSILCLWINNLGQTKCDSGTVDRPASLSGSSGTGQEHGNQRQQHEVGESWA